MDFFPEEADAPFFDGATETVFGHAIPKLKDGIAASGVIVIVRTVMADGTPCQPGVSVVESPNLAEWECPGMLIEAMKMYADYEGEEDDECL